MRFSRLVAAIAIGCAISASLSGCIGAPPRATPRFDASRLPEPPVAASVDGSDPASRAASLAASTADGVASTDAGWVAVYTELGIPIIDRREPAPTADPVGPLWSQVWAIGGLSRGTATIPLSDAVSILSLARGTTLVADDVLASLRTDAAGPDPVRATFAEFVAAKSVAAGGADPIDAATTPGQIRLDAATIQLFAWVELRRALLDSAGTNDGATGAEPPEIELVTARSEAGSAGEPCADPWGGPEDEASWTTWVSTTVEEPAPATPTAQQIGAFLTAANAVTTLVALIAELNAVTVSTTTDPPILVREKKAQPGGSAQLGFRLEFDASRLDMNDQSVCALVTAADTLGLGLAVLSDGETIPGAEIRLSEIKNFPSPIEFDPSEGDGRYTIVTNTEGVATAYTRGKARAIDLPDSARKVDDEYGFAVSAEITEEGTRSVLDLVIPGLTGELGGELQQAVDDAKYYHLQLGDAFFPYTDWQSSYRVDQIWLDGYRVTGTVCNPDLPFVLDIDGTAIPGFAGPLRFTPSNDDGFSYAFQGLFGGVALGVGNGYGTRKVTNDDIRLYLGPGYFEATMPEPVGVIPVGPNGQHFIAAASDPIILKPDPTACPG